MQEKQLRWVIKMKDFNPQEIGSVRLNNVKAIEQNDGRIKCANIIWFSSGLLILAAHFGLVLNAHRPFARRN